MAHLLDASRDAARVGVLVAVVLVAVLVGASPAVAGYWMHASCMTPSGNPASNEGWSSTAGLVTYGSTNSVACGPGGPMFALLSTQEAAPVGAHQTLVYTPPTGSTLSGGVVGVDLLADGHGYNASGVAAVYTPSFVYDQSNVVIQCAWGLLACANGTHHYNGPVTLPVNRGGKLYVSASCGGAPPNKCAEGGSDGVWSRVLVYYANLLLASGFAPAARDFHGSLLSPDAHGTASLSFAAEVPGPGIYKVRAAIDGKPAYDATPNTNGGRCAPVGIDGATGALMFSYQQPCLNALTVDLTVRTTGLRDGAHELTVVVVDAAQNAQTVLRQTITVNNRTTASSTLTSNPPASGADGAGGTPAASGPVYALALDTPTQGLTRGVRNVWARSALTLSGTARSSTGAAAAGVAVTLFAKSAADVTPRVLAQATTDDAGRWTLRAPRGPSRTLTISTGARPDPAAAGVVTIRQTVRPRVSLRVQALGRSWMRFSGRMRFEPLGSPRPLVAIQTLSAEGRWNNIRTSSVRVSASGAYSVTIDGASDTVGGSYPFRAIAHGTALYATGISPIRRAVVR